MGQKVKGGRTEINGRGMMRMKQTEMKKWWENSKFRRVAHAVFSPGYQKDTIYTNCQKWIYWKNIRLYYNPRLEAKYSTIQGVRSVVHTSFISFMPSSFFLENSTKLGGDELVVQSGEHKLSSKNKHNTRHIRKKASCWVDSQSFIFRSVLWKYTQISRLSQFLKGSVNWAYCGPHWTCDTDPFQVSHFSLQSRDIHLVVVLYVVSFRKTDYWSFPRTFTGRHQQNNSFFGPFTSLTCFRDL